MIFASTKRDTSDLALSDNISDAQMIHGDIEQATREQTLQGTQNCFYSSNKKYSFPGRKNASSSMHRCRCSWTWRPRSRFGYPDRASLRYWLVHSSVWSNRSSWTKWCLHLSLQTKTGLPAKAGWKCSWLQVWASRTRFSSWARRSGGKGR